MNQSNKAPIVVISQSQLDLLVHNGEIPKVTRTEINTKLGVNFDDDVPYHRNWNFVKEQIDKYGAVAVPQTNEDGTPACSGEGCCPDCIDDPIDPEYEEERCTFTYPDSWELPDFDSEDFITAEEESEQEPLKVIQRNGRVIILPQRQPRSMRTRNKLFHLNAQEEASLPPIDLNTNHSFQTAKWARENRSYDKYQKVPVYGVPILRKPVLSQDELKTAHRIWTRVAHGKFDLQLLCQGFRAFGKLLYDMQWYRREKYFSGYTWSHIVQTDAIRKLKYILDGYKIQRLDGISREPVEAKTHALRTWMRNYKWLLKHLGGKDGDVITHYLAQLNKHHDLVFMQNGDDEETTDSFLKNIFKKINSSIGETSLGKKAKSKAKELGKEAVTAMLDTDLANDVIEEASNKAMKSMKDRFLQACRDALTSGVTTLTGWLAKIKEALLKFKQDFTEMFVSLVPDYLIGVDVAPFMGIIAVLVFIMLTWMWWRSTTGQFVLNYLVNFLIKSTGITPTAEFTKLFDEYNTESIVSMQSESHWYTTLITGIAKGLLGLATLSSMNSVMNIVQKAPDVITKTKEFFVWFIDGLYYLFTGKKHFFPHTEELDTFKNYMEELTKFLQIPEIGKIVFVDDALTRQCLRLGKDVMTMQHVLAGLKGMSHNLINYYSKLLSTLQLMSRDCKLRSDLVKRRVEPTVLILRGKPGHGKSQSLEYFPQAIYDKVANTYTDRFPHKWDPGMEFAKTKAQIYCDGYDPEQHFCWTFEEFLCFADGTKRSEDLSLFLQLVSTKPCVLPFADCASKNKICYCSPLICMSSNAPDTSLDTVNGMTDINAYYRRRHFLFDVVRDQDVSLADMHNDLDKAWWFVIEAETDQGKKEAQKQALKGTGIDFDLLQKKKKMKFRFSQVANLVASTIIGKTHTRDLMLANQLTTNFSAYGGLPIPEPESSTTTTSGSSSSDDGAGVGANTPPNTAPVGDTVKESALMKELVDRYFELSKEQKIAERKRADDVEAIFADPRFSYSLGYLQDFKKWKAYDQFMREHGEHAYLYALWCCGLGEYTDNGILPKKVFIRAVHRSKVIQSGQNFFNTIWYSRINTDPELIETFLETGLKERQTFDLLYGKVLVDRWLKIQKPEATMQNGDSEDEEIPEGAVNVEEHIPVVNPWYHEAVEKVYSAWLLRKKILRQLQYEFETTICEEIPKTIVNSDSWFGRFARIISPWGLTEYTNQTIGTASTLNRIPEHIIFDIIHHADPADMDGFLFLFKDKILPVGLVDADTKEFFIRQFSDKRHIRKQFYNDCLSLAIAKATDLPDEELPETLQAMRGTDVLNLVLEVYAPFSPFLDAWAMHMKHGGDIRLPLDEGPNKIFGSEMLVYLKRLSWISRNGLEYLEVDDVEKQKFNYFAMRSDCKGEIPNDSIAYAALNARMSLQNFWAELKNTVGGYYHQYAHIIAPILGAALLYMCFFCGAFFLTVAATSWSKGSQQKARAKLVQGSLERAAMHSMSRGHIARIQKMKVRFHGQDSSSSEEESFVPDPVGITLKQDKDGISEIQYFNREEYLNMDEKDQVKMQNSLAESIDRQISKISSAMRDLAFTYPDGKVHGAKCLISGRRMYMNKHFFSCWGRNYTGVQIWNGDAQLMSLTPHEVVYGEDPGKRDLCWLDLPNSVNSYPSLERFFSTRQNFDSLLDKNEVSRIHRLSIGGKVLHRYALGKAASRGITKMYTTKLASGKPYELYMDEHLVTTGLENAEGMCGLPYVTVDGMGVVKILGLHCAEAGSQAVFLPLHYEDLEKSVAYMQNESTVFRRGTYVPETVRNTSTASNQSFDGRTVSLGTLDKGDHMPEKSKIIPSVFQGDSEFPPIAEMKFGRAMLKPTIVNMGTEEEPDLVLRRPFNQGMAKMVSPPVRKFPRWIKELFDKEPARIFQGFFPRHRRPFRMLTLEEALNKLDMSTSIGIDMKIKGFKSRHDLWNKETGWVHPTLRKAVTELFIAMDAGYELKNVVSACMKDETREWQRVLEGKTRIFCVGSLAHLIVTIMVMGDMVEFIKENRTETDVAIGVNPHGPEWTMFARKLRRLFKFGGGDFSGYDTSISGPFAFGLYRAMQWYSGWEGKLGWYLFNVCMSAVAPYLIINREAYWMDWMNSSGGWLTGFLNSFVNVVIFNAFFFYLCQTNDLGDLDRRMELICIFYGDDNLWAVSELMSKYFTMKTLAEFIWESFGMKYTTPSKDEITDDFLEFDDLEFLCRKFTKTGNLYHAPLSEDSIEGMLLWIKKPTDKTIDEQLAVNVEQAMMEYYHYGKELFEQKKKHIQMYCNRYSIAYNAHSYDEYHERWAHGILKV